MKVLRFALLTLVVIAVLAAISYFLSEKFGLTLIDAMFYVGVGASFFSLYFSSSGGLAENFAESEIAASYEGLKAGHSFKRTFLSLNVNFVNVGSVIFLILVFLSVFIG
ncbi:hypothetical protein A8F94_09770 [Bacillus sp. FJAT-27225]|uniref:hypothetical protein n=1 Tax=Bacillus sp. FJAT-27225 TaxID=1743144 RepID=UPI00080C20A2|nr:hypothetical protein [Bacillus sp. FJAT-27225]OCA88097.1 hypothetical protein A8F94_09770 [Bacillus sp. FJAT-27225]